MAKKNDITEAQKLDYTHVLPASLIEQNDGQLEGLPKNPRYIKDERFAKLKHSLEVSPEFLEANPLKVYPLDNGHYIILAGNMRFLAGSEIGIEKFPCYIFKKDTPTDKLKEFVIKDNIPFGNTDWDALANDDWDVSNLEDWGMDVSFLTSDEEDMDLSGLYEEHEATQKEKPITITIEVPNEMGDKVDDIKEALKVTLDEWEGCTIKK